MNTGTHISSLCSLNQEGSQLSDASKKALAILAVDNILPTKDWIELLIAIDSWSITHDEAIKMIKERALRINNES